MNFGINGISDLLTLFQDIDDCNHNFCENGASCKDLIDGYKCACPNGYDGTNCEIGKLKYTKKFTVKLTSVRGFFSYALVNFYQFAIELPYYFTFMFK